MKSTIPFMIIAAIIGGMLGAFLDLEESINEPPPPTVEEVAAPIETKEAFAESLAKDIIENIRNCPKEHALFAVFQDGTSESMPIPPFDKLIKNVGGDEQILVREFTASILYSLENGAVVIQLVHVENQGARA